MVFPKELVFNHPDHLPKNFNKIKIIGPAIDYVNQICKNKQTTSTSNAEIKPLPVFVKKGTYIGMNNQTKAIYQSNNFTALSDLKRQFQRDLSPIYNRVKEMGIEAWQYVQYDNIPYFMIWSEDGCVWSYCSSLGTVYPNSPNQRFEAGLQFGIQSNNTNLISTQMLTITTPYLMNWTDPGLILAATLGSFMGKGLGFHYTEFAYRLTENANKFFGNQFNFYTPDNNVGLTVETLVFTVIFLGLEDLLDTSNHRTRIQFFNWDQNSTWVIQSQYFRNLLSAGSDGTAPLSIPIDSFGWTLNAQFFFPRFVKDVSVDVLVPYSVQVYHNHVDTTLEKSEIAIEAYNSGSTYGFSFAANLPKLGNHTQYIEGKPYNPKLFLDSVQDKLTTTLKQTTVTQNGIPVTTSMVTTPQGVMGQIFDFRIHLGLNSSIPSNL